MPDDNYNHNSNNDKKIMIVIIILLKSKSMKTNMLVGLNRKVMIQKAQTKFNSRGKR